MVNASSAAFAVRTYTEQRELRRYLQVVREATKLRCAADIGAGYGRMSMVLQEACERVVAFEREPALVRLGRQLLPGVEFREVRSLERLPAPPGSMDFALTFTVLQHLEDACLPRVTREIKRIVRDGGFVLLCEETDHEFRAGRPHGPDGHFTVGRSVEHYELLMAPLSLALTSPRRIEAGSPRANVGSYMLFRAAERAR